MGLFSRCRALGASLLFVTVASVGGLTTTAFAQATDSTSPPATSDTPAAPAADGTVAVANPYGIQAAWGGGDFITKGDMIILLIMSAATWYIMVVKLIEQAKALAQGKEANRTFWGKPTPRDGLAGLKKGSAYWFIADCGIGSTNHAAGSMTTQVDTHTWVTLAINRATDEISSRLQGGLAVLATVGSVAPFVGLFGTVWGIYNALTAIGLSGQASIDKVAGPVGEALITTALGLAVAVPAVLGYNWLVRRNKQVMDSVRGFGSDLHAVLLSGSRLIDEISPAAKAKGV